jgi:hypothetical protein
MTEMMDNWTRKAFASALRMVGAAEPKDLLKRAQLEAEEIGESLVSSDLTALLENLPSNDPFLNSLGMHVHRWDAADSKDTWTESTQPSTQERRDLICKKLGLDSAGSAALLNKRPIFHDETVVISAPWTPWYTRERAEQHEFYWPRYRDYLLDVRELIASDVASLDTASTDVLERLTDPTRPEAHQSKGLVVGYVQSGKTANFTGVIAKSIDAGYRLIIVMTGTIELLRSQTQRRLDMEMVGRQNILGDLTSEQEARDAKIDYQEDEAWLEGGFVDLGEDDLVTEIQRLTSHRKDYQKQFKTLKIDRFEMARPLYDPQNLFRTAARLVVVKKNSTVLKKLVTDIKANKKAFSEIPVLIIDDESDLASVNTVDPETVRAAKSEGREVKERRAVNERIADMLELMPRAQYIGYTATPFANVFVDPSDPQGIFPKDFVIGLKRPDGYMGVDDFHDLEPIDGPRTYANSNERAFVRDLEAPEEDEQQQEGELARAIDMFVLTGAVKLYRMSVDRELQFRHHTMLVHHSVRKAHHSQMAEKIKRIWGSAQFSSPAGKTRLRQLYESDLVPVTEARREHGVPALPTFEALSPFVSAAIARITEHGWNPVIVVNSDKDIQQQSLDFDRYRTWRILVGGAKLSRGFTIEGLTITYFRRATKMSDSLTQMGRWFGFREGYRDLVRLFIARQATFGRRTIDLYRAFESVALDESAFRQQLERYAVWEEGAPKVLPSQIPPLVYQHLPWLMPTARNKMFNAVLVEQSEQPFTPSGYANHVDDLKKNLDVWRPILAKAQEAVRLPQGPQRGDFDALIGTLSSDDLLAAIEDTRYLYLYDERAIRPKTKFYRRLIDTGDLEDFLVVVPQPETGVREIGGVGLRAVISRDRREGRGGKFGEMTEPKHRPIVQRFVAQDVRDTALENLSSPKRGAVLLYIAEETEPEYESNPKPKLSKNDPENGLVVAFSAYIPETALEKDPAVIQFRVRDKTQEEAPTVDAPSA